MDAVQGWQPGPGLWVPEKERYGPRWKNKCDKTQKNVLKTQKERFNRYVHVSVPGDQGHDHVYSMKHTSVDHSLPSRAGKIVSDTLEGKIIPGMSRMIHLSKCRVHLCS